MFESAGGAPVRLAGAAPCLPGRDARAFATAQALPPGSAAIAALAEVDELGLDDVDRVELLAAWERCSRWVAARQSRAVVAVAGLREADRDDFAREHVRVALLGVGGSPKADVDLARALAGPLLSARQAMEAGALSWDHARVLSMETASLDVCTAREVAESVVVKAAGRTPAQFRAVVRRAVIKADPLLAEVRTRQAGEQRRVGRQFRPDAQATLLVDGPAIDVLSIWAALDARAARPAPQERRTLDQRRFDALVEICAESGAGPATTSGAAGSRRRRAQPNVVVYADAVTWAGLADEPVEIEGYGPVPAGVAREFFTDFVWRAMVTDICTAGVRAVSERTYKPSAKLVRHLRVQDRGCGFPGCGAAVAFCDADHSTPYSAGGRTDTRNCGLLCRRHHRLKTFTRWRWRRLPDGIIEWTDPYGRRWARPAVRYEPAEIPPQPHGPGTPRQPQMVRAVDDEPPSWSATSHDGGRGRSDGSAAMSAR